MARYAIKNLNGRLIVSRFTRATYGGWWARHWDITCLEDWTSWHQSND